MKYALCFILVVYSMICHANLCKYISGDDNVDNRRVYQIQKDARGYMWFLNASGVNRYDGTNWKQYTLWVDGNNVANYAYQCMLYADSRRDIWVATAEGYLLKYLPETDRFGLVTDCRKHSGQTLRFLSMDSKDNLWFCNDNTLFAYHLPTATVHCVTQPFLSLAGWLEAAPAEYYLTTPQGVFQVEMKEYAVTRLSPELTEGRCSQITCMHYHPSTRQVFLWDEEEGLCAYDCDKGGMEYYGKSNWKGARVNCIRTKSDNEIFVATDGAGIHSLNIEGGEVAPYLCAELGDGYQLRSNRVADLFIDEQKRMWIADYPDGVTIDYAAGSAGCKWYKHLRNNGQSLVNNRVNAVLHDSQGDIWFATDNGICYYNPRSGEWKQIFSPLTSNIFTSLCETGSGEIYAANYVQGIYRIHKQKLAVGEHYATLPSVNALSVKDKEELWLGTERGLYTMNRISGEICPMSLSMSPMPVHTLFHDSKSNTLYIGTEGSGMLAYDVANSTVSLCTHPFISNIQVIFPEETGNLLVGTDRGLFRYLPDKKCWRQSCNEIENLTSGTSLGNGKYILGTFQGAVEIDKHKYLVSRKEHTCLYLDNFQIALQEMLPGMEGSPLEKSLNHTSVLHLKHDQNTFSFTATSINYDEIKDIGYSWKLDGKEWSEPTNENKIQFSNLAPGEHFFSVRALSLANGHPIAQRNMRIIVDPPLWRTNGALLCYGLVSVLLGSFVVRVVSVWQERNFSREATRVFAKNMRDIYNPLALMKAPLKELCREKTSSPVLRSVLHQVEDMDSALSDLVSIQSIASHQDDFSWKEYELTGYLESAVREMEDLAQKKQVRICWKEKPGFVSVWMSREKMNSILKSVFCIFMEQMGSDEELEVIASCAEGYWKLELEAKDLGSFKKKVFTQGEMVLTSPFGR